MEETPPTDTVEDNSMEEKNKNDETEKIPKETDLPPSLAVLIPGSSSDAKPPHETNAPAEKTTETDQIQLNPAQYVQKQIRL